MQATFIWMQFALTSLRQRLGQEERGGQTLEWVGIGAIVVALTAAVAAAMPAVGTAVGGAITTLLGEIVGEG